MAFSLNHLARLRGFNHAALDNKLVRIESKINNETRKFTVVFLNEEARPPVPVLPARRMHMKPDNLCHACEFCLMVLTPKWERASLGRYCNALCQHNDVEREALNSDDEDDSNDEPTETLFAFKVPLSVLEKGPPNLHKNRKAGLWKGIQWMVVCGRDKKQNVGIFLGYNKAENSNAKKKKIHVEFRTHVLDREGKVALTCQRIAKEFDPPYDCGYGEEECDSGIFQCFQLSDVRAFDDGTGTVHMNVSACLGVGGPHFEY